MLLLIYTIYAWTIGVIFTVFYGSLAIILSIFDNSGSVVHVCGRLWGRTILGLIGIRVRVDGKENLVNDGGQILLSNHQGILDILVYEGFLPVQFRWIARKNLFDIPFLGWSMKRAGYIPIVREGRKNMMRSILTAAERVKNGITLLIFPEGTRSPDGKLGEFKKGSLLIILKSMSPIVPVLVKGSYDLLPKGTLHIKPGRINVKIFPVVHPGEMEVNERKDILKKVRDMLVSELDS